MCLFNRSDLISWFICHDSGPHSVFFGILTLLLSFIPSTFRIILAVPSKHGLCNISTVRSNPSCFNHLSMFFVTVPNAPITTGITSTFLIFHILAISYLRSLKFVHFSSSFFSIRVSNGQDGSINLQLLSFFSITVISGLSCF